MAEFQLKEINTSKIQRIHIPVVEESKILGSDLFPSLYANILILAKKNSGKTTVVYNILKQCADKDTHIIVFSATHAKDATWIAIKEYLEKKGITSTFHDDVVEDGVNLIQVYLDQMKKDNKDDDDDGEEEKRENIYNCRYDDTEEVLTVKQRKKRAKKYLSPEYIFIFDDMSMSLRNPYTSILAKQHRHYKAKVITSTQYIHDCAPDFIKQQDYILLFPSIDAEKIAILYKHIVLPIDFELFLKIYLFITQEKYQFLYIDINKSTFRKNFNQLIQHHELK
jgi:hypothetical protein